MNSPYLKKLCQGDILFAKGRPIKSMFLIRSGELGLFFEKENHLVPYKKITEKEFLGDAEIFSDKKWPWTAIVLSPTLEFLELGQGEIHESLNACPVWARNLIQVLCERLLDTENVLEENKIMDDGANVIELSKKHETLFWHKLLEYRQKFEGA